MPIKCLMKPQPQYLKKSNFNSCTLLFPCSSLPPDLLLGVKSLGSSPTLEGSLQNLELKFCSRATVKCASGTVGAVKVCARTPGVCSCALLKVYCLCRRERVRPTGLHWGVFYFSKPMLLCPSFCLLAFLLDVDSLPTV